MADKSNDLLVGLDIGSSKVVCMIASPVSSSTFKIEGLGECKSEGIEQGGVVDINQAVDCVRAAVEEAEKTANTTVKTVAAGISGPHIRTDNCIQQTIVGSGEIEQKDIDDLLNTAMSVTLPPSMRYLDVIPQEYSVDYARRIRTTIGMEGKKLEGSLHVVTAQSAQCLFLNKVIRRTGLELIDSQLIFNPLAAASAVLRPEEIDLGVALIDIGSDLSDVAVFFDKAVQYSAVHPMGGQQITDEISIKTHLSQEAAEKLKLQMGQVRYDARKDKDSFIRLPTAPGYSDDGGRILSKQALSAIIDVKVQDILEKIYYRIRDKSLHTQLGYGVVLTGGGATLPGIQRMAKEVFSSHMAGREINVRLGRPLVNYETSEFVPPELYNTESFPKQFAGYSTPQHAAVLGYLCQLNQKFWAQGSNIGSKRKLKSIGGVIKQWIFGNF